MGSVFIDGISSTRVVQDLTGVALKGAASVGATVVGTAIGDAADVALSKLLKILGKDIAGEVVEEGVEKGVKEGIENTIENTSVKFDIEEIRSDLKTDPDTAFFWSGKTDGVGGSEVAADIANSRGGVTLETTIESKNVSIPEWDINDPDSIEAWKQASTAYAEQASGEVHAVIGAELREGNIWESTEFPALMKNQNVTSITIIDPKTGIETVILER